MDTGRLVRITHYEKANSDTKRRTLGVREPNSPDDHCSFHENDDSHFMRDVEIPCTQPVAQDKILQGVVAFIDARSNSENQFEGISRQMEILGATVVRKFTADVTHVIFKDGKKSTIDRAVKKKIPVMSVLWVESCRQSGERVPEDLFPVISNKEATTPLFGRLKRTKSMQPKSFEDEVKNSAERGIRRRRRKALADNLLSNTPISRILCEDTQPPYSPVFLGPQSAFMVPDTPSPLVPESPLLNKKLDFNYSPCGESKNKRVSISSKPIAADSRTTPKSTKSESLKGKLQTTATSPRSPCCPGPAHTPVQKTRKTPRDMLLTDSTQAKKRKRLGSKKDERSGEESDNLTKNKKVKTVQEDLLLVTGTETTKISGKTLKGRLTTRGKRKALNVEENESNSETHRETDDPLATAKKQEVVTQKCRSTETEKEKGELSDSGVSVTEENEQDKETKQVASKPRLTVNNKLKFQKTAKLTDHKAIEDEEVFDKILAKKPASVSTSYKTSVQAEQTKNQTAAKAVALEEPKNVEAKVAMNTEEEGDSRKHSKAGVSLTRKKPQKNALKKPPSNRTSSNDSGDVRQTVLSKSLSPVTGKKSQKIRDDAAELPKAGAVDTKETTTENRATDEEAAGSQKAVKASEVRASSNSEDETVEGKEECSSAENWATNDKSSKALGTKCFKKRAKPKRSIVMTSMHFGEQDIVVSVVRKLGGFYIADNVGANTTHVVSGTPRRTLNVLRIIAQGGWLVSPEWVMKSLEAGYWVDEEPYELSDDFPAAQLCRLERVSADGDYQPNLFSSCGLIFLSQSTTPPPDVLTSLISLCGGQICTSVRKAEVCVGVVSRKTQAANVSEQWVLDSITKHSALPFRSYILESSDAKDRPGSPTY